MSVTIISINIKSPSHFLFPMKNISFHFIINELYSQEGIITDANTAISAGIKVIQYNDKRLQKKHVVENAFILAALCKKNNVLFFMQDAPDIAALVGADGVHLTQPDFSIDHAKRMLGDEKIIGVDFHSFRQAIDAEEKGAAYILIKINQIDSKTEQIILTQVKDLKERITLPIIIEEVSTSPTVRSILHGGADGIAVFSQTVQGNALYERIKEIAITLDSVLS